MGMDVDGLERNEYFEEELDSKLVNYDRICINLFYGDWIDQFSILSGCRGYEQVFC
jgi:hypothetical protein